MCIFDTKDFRSLTSQYNWLEVGNKYLVRIPSTESLYNYIYLEVVWKGDFRLIDLNGENILRSYNEDQIEIIEIL